MKTLLLIIDPQNSFCDPSGELYVGGAEKDMRRIADVIRRRGSEIRRIIVTLDSHNKIHIAHPIWWIDAEGNPPGPFTRISIQDLDAGRYQAADPAYRAWTRTYMETIGSQVIWPYHCLIGTWGHEVFEPLLEELNTWREEFHDLDFVMKGSSRFTENFSAIRPSVEVPDNPFTQVNRDLLRALDEADRIWVAGEASSHCVADTVTDIIRFSENPAIAEKITLVAGFETVADAFFQRMTAAGVVVSETGQLA
jgi:nicotinamidase/pyrazinamidase